MHLPQVDVVGAEPAQRGVQRAQQVPARAVAARGRGPARSPALVAITTSSRGTSVVQQRADQRLGVAVAVDVGGVDQRAAGLQNALSWSAASSLVGVPAPGHGAEPEPGDRQPAAAERSLLHGLNLIQSRTASASRQTGSATGPRSPRPWSVGSPAGTHGIVGRARCGSGSTSAIRRRGPRPPTTSALAQEADRLGYAVCWAAEAYGSDAPTVLAWVAAQTERIDVGSAVFQIPARTPAMTAMTAATLDTLSGGRFRLGLGVSGPQVSEGWHGVRFDKPLARTREYVDIVRLALAREPVAYDGEHWTLPLPDGPGKALQADRPPAARAHPDLPRRDRPEEPGADRRDRRRLAGDLLRARARRRSTLQHIERGPGARPGKTLDGFDVVPTVPVVVGDDVGGLRRR